MCVSVFSPRSAILAGKMGSNRGYHGMMAVGADTPLSSALGGHSGESMPGYSGRLFVAAAPQHMVSAAAKFWSVGCGDRCWMSTARTPNSMMSRQGRASAEMPNLPCPLSYPNVRKSISGEEQTDWLKE
ncbi:unnamed protein product [Pylaiella littoralis]